MSKSDVTSVSVIMKDMFPLPGTRIKQWVVDARRERAWASETCPRFDVTEHRDNTDAPCRNVPRAAWLDLVQHDCCHECGERGELLERLHRRQWLAEKAKRPPIEQDHDKLSDEVQPDYPPLRVPWGKR